VICQQPRRRLYKDENGDGMKNTGRVAEMAMSNADPNWINSIEEEWNGMEWNGII